MKKCCWTLQMKCMECCTRNHGKGGVMKGAYIDAKRRRIFFGWMAVKKFNLLIFLPPPISVMVGMLTEAGAAT